MIQQCFMSGMFPRGAHRTADSNWGKMDRRMWARGDGVESSTAGTGGASPAPGCASEPGSLLPGLEERWLTGGPTGDRWAEASYSESQVQCQEVSKGWDLGGLSAPFLPPQHFPVFLNAHDGNEDEDDGMDDNGH